MNFVRDFKTFEDRIDRSLDQLYKKDQHMSNDFTSRLNLLDDIQIKNDNRILFLERQGTIMKQELASHKL